MGLMRACSYNRLGGSLPGWLANKTALHDVKLEFNEFVGPIPWQLGDMSRLSVLRLEYNRLSGECLSESHDSCRIA